MQRGGGKALGLAGGGVCLGQGSGWARAPGAMVTSRSCRTRARREVSADLAPDTMLTQGALDVSPKLVM